MKFGLSDDEQAFAGGLVRAMIEGQRELEDGVPICHDPDGTPIYRVILNGMSWGKVVGGYAAFDGLQRRFCVMRRDRQWEACIYSQLDIVPQLKPFNRCSDDPLFGTLVEVTCKSFSTRREAILHCTHLARRMRWYPGALT